MRTKHESKRKDKGVLIVFFEGTANTLDPLTTQIGIFAAACQATNVTAGAGSVQVSEGPWKMAFDGCGVTHGTLGALFAAGLDEQCNSVVGVVKAIMKQHPIKVVAVGLSRGGIACMKLALKLSKFSNTEVSLSMLMFDPVAGNAVWTGFPYTASLSQNLQCCKNLERVLAIYPFEPLPDIAMHAPSLVKYPPETNVEEDVSLGCHQGALFMTSPRPTVSHTIASNLSFRRIVDYLESEGIELIFPDGIYQPTREHCLEICRNEVKKDAPKSIRITHDKTGMNRKIVRQCNEEQKHEWLNKQHRQLYIAMNSGNAKEYDLKDEDNIPYRLTFEDGFVRCM
mmetsp:Transcript_831/g.996  ORF Transcript_831/g.996 Transcript_831/m.996 type:complete len:340 (+) Transcript_831:64-1083(+)|eukprot:CAMPEP_0178901072 /NCGR_PEP_ID=MMETSP0786-20121207/3813_1 /TAXON_ID=186022 /ORGANISM="Thalassionema frauenfeldii, Strain CCMP 1798" /LENGTH=339 /DNA_ID=CAMNT_0020572121 /DNA_START=49 /DNA_END=1068 /DNA_ORIENTATION=-